MEIDIDRINDVLEGKFLPRGCGKTTAWIVTMLAQVDFGAKILLVVSIDYNRIEYVKQQICEVAYAMGFRKIKRQGNEIQINKTLIRFATENEQSRILAYRNVYKIY